MKKFWYYEKSFQFTDPKLPELLALATALNFQVTFIIY